ncbi:MULTISPECIES: hypothetical protein [Gordonia]|uniref:Uncharacterized protein n=1 Tax=Gordonia terrae C-6 TaxID=1316928 RepID=R7Y5H5_9ACTN|nr:MULTISPECIES: hypothetical protein [Gordonia]EON31313.1 hypothetical protein GTC6_18316 [Gordonia terrae C-6]
MRIRVEPNTVRVHERADLRTLSVSTTLDGTETSEQLRRRGIGYVDGDSAHINSMWLQSLGEDRRWHDDLRELFSFAECHGWFDGVYLRARLETTPVPDVRPVPRFRPRSRADASR